MAQFMALTMEIGCGGAVLCYAVGRGHDPIQCVSCMELKIENL